MSDRTGQPKDYGHTRNHYVYEQDQNARIDALERGQYHLREELHLWKESSAEARVNMTARIDNEKHEREADRKMFAALAERVDRQIERFEAHVSDQSRTMRCIFLVIGAGMALQCIEPETFFHLIQDLGGSPSIAEFARQFGRAGMILLAFLGILWKFKADGVK